MPQLCLDAPVEKSQAATIQRFCVFYLFLWTVVPVFAIGTIWRVLALMAFVVWYTNAQKRGFVLNTPVKRAIGYAVLFVSVMMILNFSPRTLFKMGIAPLMLTISICIFNFYLRHPFELSPLIPFLLITLTIFNFRTSTALTLNEHLARYIVRNSKIAFELQQQGIGGYSMIYSQVCVCPAILAWCRHILWENKDKLRWIIALAWLASYAFLLVKASYSIALFSSAISVYFIFSKKKVNVTQSALIMALIFVGMLTAIATIEPLRNFLFDVFEGTTIEKKLHDFSVMNGLATDDRFGDRNYGSIDVRMERYMWSLGTMLKFPIIGCLFFPARVGAHSAILDTIAIFGWLGGWLYCGMIFAVPNTLKCFFNNNLRMGPVINATFVVILFVGLLNTIPFEVGFNMVLVNAIFMFELIRIYVNPIAVQKNAVSPALSF